jgi:hypothetical protein
MEWRGKRHFKLVPTCKKRENTIVANNGTTINQQLVIENKGGFRSSVTSHEHMEPTQVNEEELIPPVDNPQTTKNQPPRLKCGRELISTKKYTEYTQQLTAKLTTREDFVN